MVIDKTWTRVLAMALVLPLAAACAETGEDEIDDTETLETTPATEMNRVELESFGTEDINGWITSRTEGQDVVLTLNFGESRMGMETPASGTEDEMGTESEMGTEGEMHYSARVVEGMCLDVRPGSTGIGESAETGTAQPGEESQEEGMSAQRSVTTVAEFEPPHERSGMESSAESGTESYGSSDRTSPMSGHTLEARISQSETTGAARSYAVVVEDGSQESDAAAQQDENSNVVACADVTRLIRNSGQPAGTTGQQPMDGEGTERGSDESGSND